MKRWRWVRRSVLGVVLALVMLGAPVASGPLAARAVSSASNTVAPVTTHAATPLRTQGATPAAISGLHVAGNQLLNGGNQPVILHGVDRSGTEYACIQGWGIFDGPSDAASVQAIAAWHTSAVRVPLNEDCWLNINGVNPAYGGAPYQQAIANYVTLLNSYGLVAILEMHLNAPGTQQATGQQPMPDQDHAPAFWASVASYFKGNSAVIFDLYNEPYPDSDQDTTAAWTCWRDGGTCPGVPFQAAGMQELVSTVRATGATNVIMLGGVQYAGTLSQWLAYEPSDPTGNLAASWHSYNSTACNTTACWNGQVAPVAAHVPLIVGEIGEYDCAHSYIDRLMAWLDTQHQSYLAWTWDTWPCGGGPALISDYSGTPTPFGLGYKAHLAALAGAASLAPSSASGTPFQTLTVSGAGFGAAEQVALYWDSSANTALATATSQADGSLAATITLPQAANGPHSLIAVGQSSGAEAITTVQVTPAVFLFPAAGASGSRAYLVGVGFGAGEAVAGLWYPGFSLLNDVASNAVGTVVMAFVVPTSAPGTYYAIGYGVSSHLYAYAPYTVTAAGTASGAKRHAPPLGPPPAPPYLRQ